MARDALGDGKSAGLCNDEIGYVHIVLNVVYKVEELCVARGIKLLYLFIKVVKKLDVAAGDNDHLDVFAGLRELLVKVEHTRHAERTRHKQNSGYFGVEPFALAKLFARLVFRKAVKGGDTERIYLAFGYFIFFQKLFSHLRLREYKGFDIRRDICAVRVVVGDQADRFYIKLALFFKIRDHIGYEGMADDDDIGIVFLDRLKQLICVHFV